MTSITFNKPLTDEERKMLGDFLVSLGEEILQSKHPVGEALVNMEYHTRDEDVEGTPRQRLLGKTVEVSCLIGAKE